ncbi:bromodomain-containing protein DDB_G0280777-like [Epinephelus fuscoguttatus]|uniref:bromodomain-containing protein DDB_G0280777-like n=1 Tax=Epinephelus fuscoguttatus TaxID=293821 RepID=UPI0020D06804|nr:bromodomain-containing protein DDB_G0280777-like [Epinephelus fuscoguttatus]
MDFLLIKERAQQERSSSTDSSQVPAPSCLTTEQPPEEKEPTSPEQVQDPQLNRTITELKVKFTELERELVQLRELISQQPCQPTTAQPDPCTISTELGMLRQDRDSCRRELSLLRTEIRELHQDREQRLAALTALTEEVEELRGEREEHRRELTSLSKEVEELRGEREEHSRALTTLSEQPQERGGATQDLDEKLDHNQDPVSSQDPPIQEPTPTPSSTSSPQTSTSPHSTRPAQQREKTDIVLLIDSNGKFLNEKKLFPTHNVAKIWCPNTHHAIDLLSEERLGSPSHIIIHTGTNDLEPAGEDFHPDTIHRINSSLSRDCARRPNVHLAHHPTLDISCLYDHVHLFKSTVPIFAQTLKSVALNRDQSTARRKSTSAHNPTEHQDILNQHPDQHNGDKTTSAPPTSCPNQTPQRQP